MLARRLLLAAPLVLLLASAAPGERAPRLKARGLSDLARPLPAPYDRSRDADADVAGAIARAKAGGRIVLVEFGGNWCVDCRVLAGILALPEMRPWIARHFELVHVDVGAFDRNLHLPAKLGLPRLRAVPALLVIDPRTGRLRNPGRELALADAAIMTPQAVADWMAQWIP